MGSNKLSPRRLEVLDNIRMLLKWGNTVRGISEVYKHEGITPQLIYSHNHNHWHFNLRKRQIGKRAKFNRKFSDTQEFKMVDLYKEGYTTPEISMRFNCSSHTVARLLRLRGVKLRRSGCRKGKMCGAAHPMWRGGRTKDLSNSYRFSSEYKQWRQEVFRRDNFTCQICGSSGVRLHADHIKEQSIYPDLRYDVNNGRTLCIPCHRKTDNYGMRRKEGD